MDETKDRQDISLADNEGGTPEKTTYSQEEVDKIRLDSRAAAMAELGRQTKAAEQLAKRVKDAEDRSAKFIKQMEDAEESRYRDDSDKLADIRRRREEREREAELAKKDTELSEAKGRLAELEKKEDEHTKELNAREVATRLGVDPKLLARLARLTDGSIEAIEAEAKDLPKKEERDALKINRSATGGGRAFTAEQLADPAFVREHMKEIMEEHGKGNIKPK